MSHTDREASLPIPPHFDPERVNQVWRVPYADLAEAAPAWRREHSITAASRDSVRTLLVAVDMQNTFCVPGFELFVGGRTGRGAVDDVRRLCEFIYHNLNRLTGISATMDTHRAMQIFHPLYWVDAAGRHPPPYTLISADDVLDGRWRVNPDVAESVSGGDLRTLQHTAEFYVQRLREGGKYDLTIWPYHAMAGGIGHALVSSLEEAFFFHNLVRSSQTGFELKGDNPLTENYSVLKPEVLEGPGGVPIGQKNERFIQEVLSYDVVILAGEAKSHCLAWTVDDLLSEMKAHSSKQVKEVYLLEDCTSPVVVQGTIDYTDQAEDAFARFADEGIHIVRSTDPIDSWPKYPL